MMNTTITIPIEKAWFDTFWNLWTKENIVLEKCGNAS